MTDVEDLKEKIKSQMYSGRLATIIGLRFLSTVYIYFLLLYRVFRAKFFRIPYDPVEYFVSRELQVIYVVNSKCACTTIKKSLLSMANRSAHDVDPQFDKVRVHLQSKRRGYFRRKIVGDERQYEMFTVVRNPFERLVSCYVNKFEDVAKITVEKFYFRYYLGGILKQDMSFEEFVRIVCEVPDELSDRHFKSQSYLIFQESKGVDHVAKLEDLSSEGAIISTKWSLPKLERLNSSKPYDYRVYYSPKLFQMVSLRYACDIENFGYKNVRDELHRYLEGC